MDKLAEAEQSLLAAQEEAAENNRRLEKKLEHVESRLKVSTPRQNASKREEEVSQALKSAIEDKAKQLKKMRTLEDELQVFRKKMSKVRAMEDEVQALRGKVQHSEDELAVLRGQVAGAHDRERVLQASEDRVRTLRKESLALKEEVVG